jgi:alcohol dehydrogenase class IV
MASTFPGGTETVFTYGAPLLKFGTGAADEIGYDLSQYGARRVLVVTDPEGDVPGLVEGTMKQQRLLDTAPRPVTEDDAAAILVRSLSNW